MRRRIHNWAKVSWSYRPTKLKTQVVWNLLLACPIYPEFWKTLSGACRAEHAIPYQVYLYKRKTAARELGRFLGRVRLPCFSLFANLAANEFHLALSCRARKESIEMVLRAYNYKYAKLLWANYSFSLTRCDMSFTHSFNSLTFLCAAFAFDSNKFLSHKTSSQLISFPPLLLKKSASSVSTQSSSIFPPLLLWFCPQTWLLRVLGMVGSGIGRLCQKRGENETITPDRHTLIASLRNWKLTGQKFPH